MPGRREMILYEKSADDYLTVKTSPRLFQDDGERSVVPEADIHMGAEYAVGNDGDGFPAFFHEVFIKLFGELRLCGLSEAGAVAVAAVRIKSELGND